MSDGTTYLLNSINRKVLLLVNSRLTKKQQALLDAILADVERIRGRLGADSPKDTQAKTEGQ